MDLFTGSFLSESAWGREAQDPYSLIPAPCRYAWGMLAQKPPCVKRVDRALGSELSCP